MTRCPLLGSIALAVSAGAGCGDNWVVEGAPLGPAAEVAIVAHPDDDLIFMQPDLGDAVRDESGVTIVYVTAGNGRHGLDTAERRYDAVRAAYARAAGVEDRYAWFCGAIELAGHHADHCRLEPGNISLVFLGYPDGGKEGEQPASLSSLWRGEIESAETIGRQTTRYDRAGLIAAVTAVLDLVGPHTVHTLEIAQTHGRDHADHRIAGALALVAVAASQSNPAIVAHRGYAVESEPVNLTGPVFSRAADALAHYTACVDGCAPCGEPCDEIQPAHATWLARQYAIGMRRTAAGVLRWTDATGSDACAAADASGSLALAACATAEPWRLAADGTLHAGERCIQILPTGELVAGASCAADAAHRFFLDDEGHAWLGLPPIADPDAQDEHAYLRCLVVAGGRPRAGLCGESRAPVWELLPSSRSSVRPFAGRPVRAIRLGDLTGDGRADLCAIDASGLRCAPGRGDGTFGPLARIGPPAAPLVVEPESLALGDVDGDGRLDACGRAADGVRCATSADGFAATRWTAAFARTGGPDATDRTLAIADLDGDGRGELCAITTTGLVCAARAGSPAVRSPWATTATALWTGDLDGDRRDDWCASRDGQLACALERHRAITSEPTPWSYAQGGAIEPSPTEVARGALADIDGDGRADLCSVEGARIVCARSHGFGLGPRFTLAALPRATGPGLWLGDLDGDGDVDACVEDGAQITCVVR